MPIHDWTRVDAGIFHDFHHGWVEECKRVLNRGLLPADCYALAEQLAGGIGPDVLALRAPAGDAPRAGGTGGGVALAAVPPRVRFHARAEADLYARRASAVVIRHRSGDRVVAILEIVSPGNKNSRARFDAFVRKAGDAIAAGVHLLIVDLFPPGPRDPQGIHRAIWDDREDEFTFSTEQSLTCASCVAGPLPEAFVEPVGVGDPLPDMPLFLTPDLYVPVPLEATYRSAWDAVPARWRDVLAPPVPG